MIKSASHSLVSSMITEHASPSRTTGSATCPAVCKASAARAVSCSARSRKSCCTRSRLPLMLYQASAVGGGKIAPPIAHALLCPLAKVWPRPRSLLPSRRQGVLHSSTPRSIEVPVSLRRREDHQVKGGLFCSSCPAGFQTASSLRELLEQFCILHFGSTGAPALCHASKPSYSGCTFFQPCSNNICATRALEASCGQVQ